MGLQNDYFVRTQRLMPIVGQDDAVKERIKIGFTSAYSKLYHMAPLDGLIEGMKELGAGTMHTVIGLGRSIVDPSKNNEIPLLLKVNHRTPYGMWGNFNDIEGQALAYERAFERDNNPPYFIGVVTANVLYRGQMKRLQGLIMEDVSFGKTRCLEEFPDDEHCFVIMSDGSRVRRFIDPSWPEFVDGDKLRYSSDSVRLDL